MTTNFLFWAAVWALIVGRIWPAIVIIAALGLIQCVRAFDFDPSPFAEEAEVHPAIQALIWLPLAGFLWLQFGLGFPTR